MAIVTATRAEYGLLSPLIRLINTDCELTLDLIVTGAHLSDKYGYTLDEIRKDGFDIDYEIPILDEDNSPLGISITMANAIKGFARCFKDDRPDMVVILGDRTEMLGVAVAALNERIPIAHIHGGEVTEGAIDDCIRHAITKMSYLHFASTEVYRNRIIQMGEEPDRVFNVGALGTENILSQQLLTEEVFRKDVGIPDGMDYAVVTFHPVTMEDDTVEKQIEELCESMKSKSNYFYLITGSNADAGGDKANNILRTFASDSKNRCFVQSLGMERYLSAVKYAAFVLGNSSSGIIEAPTLGTPTVNIGDRQKGRIMAPSVICCKPFVDDIVNAIERAVLFGKRPSKLYGDGHTSEKIVYEIKRSFIDGIRLKKSFYNSSVKI